MSRIILNRNSATLRAVATAALCAASPASASVVIVQPLPDSASTAAPQSTFASGLTQRSTLLGDMFGLRPLLAQAGLSLALAETSELLGNATGGLTRAAAYDGLTLASLQLDSRRAFGLPGGTFQISALQYHGRSLSADTLHTLQTASGIEADRATRLWELWYDQKFCNNLVDLKLGEQSLDTEYMVSTDALLFVNTMLGWPLVPSADLPGGGPAYPLAAPGMRLRVQATPNLTLLGGIYNGSPTHSSCRGDPQLCNASGTSLPLDTAPLIIARRNTASPANGDMVAPGQSPTLPGTWKLGFWIDTVTFPDPRIDTRPRSHQTDWSVYAVIDQTVWQNPDGGAQSLGAFLRVMGAPSDRNLVAASVNAGLVWHDPIPHREDDSLGVALGYGRIGQSARGDDLDTQRLTGTGFARTGETFLEAAYQYEPFDWWQIEPDAQYVFNPGAGIANPADPPHKLHNEAVFGLRTTLIF